MIVYCATSVGGAFLSATLSGTYGTATGVPPLEAFLGRFILRAGRTSIPASISLRVAIQGGSSCFLGRALPPVAPPAMVSRGVLYSLSTRGWPFLQCLAVESPFPCYGTRLSPEQQALDWTKGGGNTLLFLYGALSRLGPKRHLYCCVHFISSRLVPSPLVLTYLVFCISCWS